MGMSVNRETEELVPNWEELGRGTGRQQVGGKGQVVGIIPEPFRCRLSALLPPGGRILIHQAVLQGHQVPSSVAASAKFRLK